MSPMRGETASLLLDRLPENERLKVVRKVTDSLEAKSSNADVQFAAVLWKLQPDEIAKEALLGHLQKQIENGSDEVASIPDLEQELFSRIVSVTAQSSSSSNEGVEELHGDSARGQRQTNGTSNDESERNPTALRRTVNCLRYASRKAPVELPETSSRRLLEACLVLVVTPEKDVAISAQECLYALLAARPRLTASEQEQLWKRIQSLSAEKDPGLKTIGFSLWLRWTLNQHVDESILSQSAWWNLIVDGLINGDSERRKSALQVLRSSVEVSARSPSLVSMIAARSDFHAHSPDMIIKQYGRFCNTFETIILGRYLNQVLECEADLDFLSSAESAVKPIWLYTLLSSALDHRLQESNRKFIGTWIMTSTIRPDSTYAFLDFFRKDFLPWVTAGNLFTSTLRRQEGILRCEHGDKLATYIVQLLNDDPEFASSIVDAILDSILARKNNNFAYSMVYQVAGLARAWDTIDSLEPKAEQLEKLIQVASGSAIPEIARDYALARCWKLCFSHKQDDPSSTNIAIESSSARWQRLQERARKMNADSSAQTDGTIASQALDPSKREVNEQVALRKCADLIGMLDRTVSEDDAHLFNERVNELWSDMEYLEYPKALLIALPKLILNRNLVEVAARTASSHDALARTLHEKTQLLLEQGDRRSYLLAPIVSAIRDAALSSPESASVLRLEDLIVYIAEHPPTTTIDPLLEETASVLLQSIDPSLRNFSYEYYFGERESYGFAALIDMTNRLGSLDMTLAENLLNRILDRWVKQKLPAPTVSQWKTSLQLQIMLLCAEQYLPTATEAQAGKLLRAFYHVLANEPLPTLRYIIEWAIARTYIHHPALRQTIFNELSTKDHHSNPKFLASLMKIGVTLAKTSASDEAFALKLATVFVPLAASSKVVIRHEAQWQVPILLDHAREQQWSSITDSAAFIALDEFIRSLERYSDPPPDRLMDRFDPIEDHNLTHLVSGPWWDLDQVEQRKCQHADFVRLLATSSSSSSLPAPCLPLGPAPTSTSSSSATPAPGRPTIDLITRRDQNIAAISQALRTGNKNAPKSHPSTALQTKGTSYLSTSTRTTTTTTPTRPSPLIVIASLVDNPYNLGGLSRVSEIFGASTLYVSDPRVTSSKDFTSVSVSSHFHLPILPLLPDDIPSFVAKKRKDEGFTVVGIEQTDRSVIIGSSTSDFCSDSDGEERTSEERASDERAINNTTKASRRRSRRKRPLAHLPRKSILILGAERSGIPAKILSECGLLVEIEQVGVTRSLNVQTAAGIVLSEYVRQRRGEREEE